MKGEHQGYREELAKQIKQAPKEKRRELLDQAKFEEFNCYFRSRESEDSTRAPHHVSIGHFVFDMRL